MAPRTTTRSTTAIDGDRCISQAVVETVADAKGVSPLDVRATLNDVVDVDALDAIFRRQSGGAHCDARVSFAYADCDVTVYSHGFVEAQVDDAR